MFFNIIETWSLFADIRLSVIVPNPYLHNMSAIYFCTILLVIFRRFNDCRSKLMALSSLCWISLNSKYVIFIISFLLFLNFTRSVSFCYFCDLYKWYSLYWKVPLASGTLMNFKFCSGLESLLQQTTFLLCNHLFCIFWLKPLSFINSQCKFWFIVLG